MYERKNIKKELELNSILREKKWRNIRFLQKKKSYQGEGKFNKIDKIIDTRKAQEDIRT